MDTQYDEVIFNLTKIHTCQIRPTLNDGIVMEQ